MVVSGDAPHRFVIHDRDSIYSEGVDRTIQAMGLTVLKTPVRSPQANAFCERAIGTIRRECLDWMIPLNEGHLRGVLRQWVVHYNRGRPHASLGPGIPDRPGNDLTPLSPSQSPWIGQPATRLRPSDSPTWTILADSSSYLRSWSRIKKRTGSVRSANVHATCRACCVTHFPLGCEVQPASARRLPISMKNSTYNRWNQIVSTVNKSVAMTLFACARRNSRHDGPGRVSAGPTCCSPERSGLWSLTRQCPVLSVRQRCADNPSADSRVPTAQSALESLG